MAYLIRILISVIVFALIATAAAAVDLTLRWDASQGATGYNVYMSGDMGLTWSAARDAGVDTTFIWLNAPEDRLVLFKVSAYNAAGTETVNEWAGTWYDFRKLPPAAPTQLRQP